MDTLHDFSKCLYDIAAVPPGTALCDYYPDLKDYDEFSTPLTDREQRIAIAICDFKSPFVRMDHELRVGKIFELLDIGLKNLITQTLHKEVIKFSNDRVNACMAKYLMIQANHEFSLWFSNYLAFYQLMEEHRKPINYTTATEAQINASITRKRLLSSEAEKMKAALVNQETFLFGDTRVKQAVVLTELKKIRTYPEMFASENAVF